jgi:hypothetical protein
MDNYVDERDYRLLENDKYTFFVLNKIMGGECRVLLTDHERLIICRSNNPFPVWIWTSDDASEEDMERAYQDLKNRFTGGDIKMAVSKTKYDASEAEIKELFSFHKVGDVTEVATLGNGEFNAAYKVTCDDGTSYALKIAPPEDAKVLSYEKRMMESEGFWYSQMHDKTDILCPKVYASDFSKKIIKSNCFIMEMMEGEPLYAMNFSDRE